LLVVDDDRIVLRGIRRLLLGARPGWEIDLAESGDTALQLLRSRTYDVVVTDLQMPLGDGVALLQRLKTEQPSLMRVIHSSHAESFTSAQLEELCHAVVTKPGRPDELVTVLEWVLEQRRRSIRDSIGY
jgi:two-component system response regulator YesN